MKDLSLPLIPMKESRALMSQRNTIDVSNKLIPRLRPNLSQTNTNNNAVATVGGLKTAKNLSRNALALEPQHQMKDVRRSMINKYSDH